MGGRGGRLRVNRDTLLHVHRGITLSGLDHTKQGHLCFKVCPCYTGSVPVEHQFLLRLPFAINCHALPHSLPCTAPHTAPCTAIYIAHTLPHALPPHTALHGTTCPQVVSELPGNRRNLILSAGTLCVLWSEPDGPANPQLQVAMVAKDRPASLRWAYITSLPVLPPSHPLIILLCSITHQNGSRTLPGILGLGD